MLPWTSSTHTPSSGPPTKQWVRIAAGLHHHLVHAGLLLDRGCRKVMAGEVAMGGGGARGRDEAGEAGSTPGAGPDRPAFRPLCRRRALARLAGPGQPPRQGRPPGHLRAAGPGGRLPVEPAPASDLLDDQPVTAVAAMQLYEEGRSPSRSRPPVHPLLRGHRGLPRGPASGRARPGHRARAARHLLTHTAGLTTVPPHPVDAMYLAAGFDWWPRKAATSPSTATCGPVCRCRSSRAASGITRSPRRPRPGRQGGRRAAA